MEQTQSEASLKGALWCFDRLPSTLKSHPVIGTTLRVGVSPLFTNFQSTSNSPLYPILGNPAFPPGIEQTGYGILKSTGRDRASRFLPDNNWPSLQYLTLERGQFQLSFWTAIQLHHFLHSIPNPAQFNRDLTTFENYCNDEGILPQVLSKTYYMSCSIPLRNNRT